jgi:membrane associated rhomboid family serine protease
MFVLVPLGSDQSVRRYPWFTIGVIVLCLLVQIHEQMVAPSPAVRDAATDQLIAVTQEVMTRAQEQPDRATWMRDFEQGHVAGEDEALYLDYKAAIEQMQKLVGKTFVAQWAYHPGHSSLINALLSAFVHAGWLHLIGNMLFLWLIGCNLEDRWGHLPFAALYLTGAFVAAFAYSLAHPHTPLGVVGASGAIAAGMGAFAVTHYDASIRMAYFIASTRIRSGTFWIRALYALPIWFALQLWLASRESDVTPVAYSAHVGGYLFGAAVAGILKLTGIEARHLIPAANKGMEWSEDPEYLEAHQFLAAQRYPEARTRIANVLARNPEHAAAREAQIRIAAALGDRTILDTALAPEIDRLSRDRRHADIHDLYTLAEKHAVPLTDRALAQVLKSAADQRDVDCVERTMRRLVVEHRDSPVIPKALFETAQAQAAAGRTDASHKTLSDLVARYPMDPIADEAKRQIADQKV